VFSVRLQLSSTHNLQIAADPASVPGPVRADIRWGTGFPISTAVPPHQCSILIFKLIPMQSEGQANKLSHKATLCRISGAAMSYGCMRHRFGHASRNGVLLTAYKLSYSEPAVTHMEWYMADWSIAKDWEGSGRGIIYGTLLKCL